MLCLVNDCNQAAQFIQLTTAKSAPADKPFSYSTTHRHHARAMLQPQLFDMTNRKWVGKSVTLSDCR